MFRAIWEFALSADSAALSENSQKALQSADWRAFWGPAVAQRFLGILSGAALSGALQMVTTSRSWMWVRG